MRSNIKALFLFLILLVLSPFFVLAQNTNSLPNPGITPESPLYFFDRLGETLQEFFTINLESKARLQMTFAAERIAEIKAIFETKGIQAKGIEVAQNRLQAHLANINAIITKQKSEGKDVSRLANELDEEFELSKTILEQTFKDLKLPFEIKEKELKLKIYEAKQLSNTAAVKNLNQQLNQVKTQKELLEIKEEETEEALEQEEERIEEVMEAKEKAKEAIEEAEEEKQEILDEAAKNEIVLPSELFTDFSNFLAQAKSAFAAGDFVKARNFAKQAEKSLDDVEELIEKQKEEQEEKEQEIKEKEEAERLKKEQEKINGNTNKTENTNKQKEEAHEEEDED